MVFNCYKHLRRLSVFIKLYIFNLFYRNSANQINTTINRNNTITIKNLLILEKQINTIIQKESFSKINFDAFEIIKQKN